MRSLVRVRSTIEKYAHRSTCRPNAFPITNEVLSVHRFRVLRREFWNSNLMYTTLLHPLNHHLFSLLNEFRTHLTILRITQRPHNSTLRPLPHQRPQTTNNVPATHIHAPLIRQHSQHLPDLEPSREPFQQLARALDALRYVLQLQKVAKQAYMGGLTCFSRTLPCCPA